MIDRIDHIVLTVADIEKTVDFYVRGLGMRHQIFAGQRHALFFGQQKINLHEALGKPILPRATYPTTGSADLCLIAGRPLDVVEAHLRAEGFLTEAGPILRDGATGAIRSIYLRDPDGNLVEVSEYV